MNCIHRGHMVIGLQRWDVLKTCHLRVVLLKMLHELKILLVEGRSISFGKALGYIYSNEKPLLVKIES